MKLANTSWNFQVDFEENMIAQLIIEEPTAFRQYLCDFYEQLNGFDGKNILSRDETILEIATKVDLIINPFTLDVNNRKVLNGLHGKLSREIIDSEKYMDLNELYCQMTKLLSGVERDLGYELVWQEQPDAKHFLKAFDVKLEERYLDFEDKVLSYVEVMREFCSVECFAFVNLKDFLNRKQLQMLCQELMYKKVAVLLIESQQKYRLEHEKTWIIDENLCEIY